MAKLSARGRTVQAEITREYSAEQLQAATDARVARDYPDGTWIPYGKTEAEPIPDSVKESLTIWERVTKRLMSDGKVLEKRDVRFRPDWLDKAGRRHSYGWKVAATLKPGKTAADFIAIYSAPRKDGSPSPWTVSGASSARTPVISQRRVMAALKRDDHTGFCLACGAEQGGCEPDACGYPCEACGKPEVYGAEELAIGSF